MFSFRQTIAATDPEIATGHPRGIAASAGSHRTDRIGKLRVARGDGGPGPLLTNKYAEGYPGKRYYGGCEHVDVAEQLAIDRAKLLFRRRLRQRAAAIRGRRRMPAVYLRAAQARRHDSRHVPRARRTPDARRVGERSSGKLYQGRRLRPAIRTPREIDYDEVERLAHEHKPTHDRRQASRRTRA